MGKTIKKVSGLIMLFFIIQTTILAQTKQAIYNNPNIVWAGIVDLDFVIDADSNTNWKKYEISGFNYEFKQKTRPLKAHKQTLNELIINEVATIQFYEYDSLKYKKSYQSLELSDPMYEPENYGDEGKLFSFKAFNVFRLKCFIYYDKLELNFRLVPQAVAVMRPLYDVPEEILGYDILGWLPVEHLAEAINTNDKNNDWATHFDRDLPLYSVKVFKQEWTVEEVMNDFMHNIRKQAATIELYQNTWEGIHKMEAENIKLLGLDELFAASFDGFDEEAQYVPWSPEMYQGIRFSMNWFWSDKKQTLSIQQEAFSPLVFIEENEEILGVTRLFLKKY